MLYTADVTVRTVALYATAYLVTVYYTSAVPYSTLHTMNTLLYKHYQQYKGINVQNSTVQCSAVQCSAVQYSTVQYSTVQYSTVQRSTVQYSTVQYSCLLYTSDAADE